MKTRWCIALGFVRLIAVDAHAQDAGAPPPECRTRNNLQHVWSNAFRRGEKSVQRAFAKIGGDCERSDDLRARLLDELAQWIPQAKGDQRTPACIGHGLVAGVYAGLAELDDVCFAVCIRDGAFIGELSGVLYCELSIALGGLALDLPLPEPPPSLCGERFEAACDEAFAQTTSSFANDEGASCLPYVETPFVAVWQQTRDNQCLFEP